MKRFLLLNLLITLHAKAAPVTVNLSGTDASETSGDGFAFFIPNLDGINTNPDGSVNYNPLTYPPLPFDVNAPAPPASGAAFDFGTFTYDDSGLSGSGVETIAVTPGMFAFDFSTYSLAMGTELDIRPPTAAGQIIVLSNVSGPGLRLVDGEARRLDFTADISWMPTINGVAQTFKPPSIANSPYRGTLTVVNGTFTFDLSDSPRNYYIGASNVIFEFDLVANVAALSEAPSLVLPELGVAQKNASEVEVSINFTEPGNGSYQLESSTTLGAGGWTPIGNPFQASPVPATVTRTILPGGKEFFRIRRVMP